ncbi:MAG: hypothetical protein K9N47_29775 [Prosthecobacter sp.]|uniref:hypothetical protein n=1 Tax=Prosthecobacter sp. TaxID=1965333 RepID=UPI00262B0A63|nr:hypothetical protein [Prosthecobacter sp.]MCF7790346.1 hypothetical protein [Prosthecobacter sp.]
MKTHLTHSPARSRFACLFYLLLIPAATLSVHAQQPEPAEPEPIPDANGKIPYVPSPFAGVSPERFNAYTKVLPTLTPEVLRALPDDSVLLEDLFWFEITTHHGRSPEKDMIEKEMWRRGDVTIRIVKKLFEHPCLEDDVICIAPWLKSRPWMKPEEFLPQARRWYEFSKAKRPGYKKNFYYQQTTIELLSHWGDAKDEPLINEFFNKYGVEQWQKDHLMKSFRERQELRAQGKPRGMPAWFFDPKHKMDKWTAIPLSDITKTYKEKMAEQAK